MKKSLHLEVITNNFPLHLCTTELLEELQQPQPNHFVWLIEHEPYESTLTESWELIRDHVTNHKESHQMIVVSTYDRWRGECSFQKIGWGQPMYRLHRSEPEFVSTEFDD